ncbi:two-component sensor histidine kinase [Paenibacillus marchantiophytorum]|uniref:histidine kinase n=1 Tax=Paenibacillus marchantiophytorum TaxID=1619310 RepID=A0ABQ1EKZ0_9BACL|nr:HAMP domain-containing sensor histidine kinase [Paenibacillus marchantiophytorum]GFZ75849.1 two-component sensor histidine kinase [Paenibacillus marchantiophytorum]
MTSFFLATIAIAAVALIHLYLIKNEMKRIHAQLHAYNQGLTGKKIDLVFSDRNLEQLAAEINNLMDFVSDAKALRRRTEYELKQSISNISHDLRTPLTSILGYIQLLESDQLSEEEKREYVSIAKIRAKRLQVLLNDFFELSVIESMDYELKREMVDMSALVPDILFGFYDRMNERNREAIIQLPDEKIDLIGNESAIKRVVENLVTNAIHYSDGPIWISMESLDLTVALSISNEAKHLKASDLNILFDRFYTEDRSRSDTGTGLGLFIARSLMVKMNGELTAELLENQLVMKCVWRLDRG